MLVSTKGADPRLWAKPKPNLLRSFLPFILPRVFRSQKGPVACFAALSLFYGILRAVVGVEVTLLLNRDVEGAVLRVQRHFIKERLLYS